MSNNENLIKNCDQTIPKDENIDLKISSLMTLNSFLIDELEVNLSINLSDDLKNIIKTNLNEYEQLNLRKLEEKDLIISQLKQNLVDLTEKRFRTSIIQNAPTANLPLENIEFLISEKEKRINELLDDLSEKNREISKLKETIKNQDDVILSHNNNIYELKNNNQVVLKAKQESFRVMTEDLNQKQKLIEEQNETIKDLKEKIDRLQQDYDQTRLDLEKRLNEKETDLQIKIAHFEANLREGKIYFEEILSEKSKEITKLKQKLSTFDHTESDSLTNDLKEETNNHQNSTNPIQKFESENIKNIKSLYEHQIDILKVKIEMLEKTCNNYQQGIKEMNKNFGIQQLSDEANSIQIFKDLMQDLQKTNVRLETEKIDLEVNNSKLQSLLEQTKIEKENLNKKFQNTDQINQKLTQEKIELDSYYRGLIDSKISELSELNQRYNSLNIEYERLREDNIRLGQISLEYDQLKITNEELT
ncbi:unnamed protein product, partial [Brachionus calyciflorus]